MFAHVHLCTYACVRLHTHTHTHAHSLLANLSLHPDVCFKNENYQKCLLVFYIVFLIIIQKGLLHTLLLLLCRGTMQCYDTHIK